MRRACCKALCAKAPYRCNGSVSDRVFRAATIAGCALADQDNV